MNDVEYKEQVKGILNDFSHELEKITKKYELQWFKTSKPLPDGDYGWRWNKESRGKRLLVVVNGKLYFSRDEYLNTELAWQQFFEGEWFGPIKFPD